LATSPRDAVVVDASVAINLNATNCARAILGALPFEVVITDVAAGELRADRRGKRDDGALLAELTRTNHLRQVSLGEAAEALFESLVIGAAADTLDDAEAATIADAVEQDICPAIDERKVLRLCAARFPKLRAITTVDLLMVPAVMEVLGREALADAVFHALRIGRMRVVAARLDWVVGLIGPDRAAQCPSLPAAARRHLG